MTDKPRFIHRAARDEQHPYFMMRRATAQDTNLTFEARGMLAYILSKPDDWRVQAKDLEQNCGKSVVYRVLGELIRQGYIKRLPMRNDKKQIVSWDYSVYEEPLPKNQEVALQEVAKQDLGNQHHTEYREEQNKEITPMAGAKRQRVVNPVFNLVALKSFGISDTAKLDGQAGRIGKVTGWLKKHGATEENVTAFYLWYARETKAASPPRDVDKFVEWYVKFEEMVKRAAAPNIIPFDLDKWEVPELEGAS